MKQKQTAVVASQKEIAPQIFDMWINTELAAEARPGQFVCVYPKDRSTLLPRPISICEVKYSKTIYSINKAEHEKINYREEAFRKETGTEKGIQTCIITTFGLKQNSHSDIADQTITLKDLFTKIP